MTPPPAPTSNVIALRSNAAPHLAGARGEPPRLRAVGRDPAAAIAHQESQQRALQRQRAWLRECAVIAGSYALNGLLFGLYALTGTVPWTAGLLYTACGFMVTGAAAGLIASGHNLRFQDASLASAHTLGAVCASLLGVALYPTMAFAHALILLTVVLTATYRMPRRHVMLLMATAMLVFTLLTTGLGHQLSVPGAGLGEQLLSWLFVVTTIGRSIVLSLINTHNNRLLRERGLQMKAKLAEIERQANHDELTGLYNRRRMFHMLGDEIARHQRSGVPVTVALLDLDHFKAVNDTLGHLAGDEVLKRFASTVQAHARATDRVGRHGGEEFLLVLTGTDLTQAEEAVARARHAVTLVDWSDIAPGLRITFSAGIATCNGDESAELLLARADLGLYEAKRHGRNCTRAV